MNRREKEERLVTALKEAQAVVIGAGAGLSASAGFTYRGERFQTYFGDFAAEYGFEDMYSGGFYAFGSLEEQWAYWSRYIYINRYMDAPKPVYRDLLKLIEDKEYFVMTTNVDHCFQKAGFSKKRLFYMQGDYGLFQCQKPCHKKTYDNQDMVREMVKAQGYVLGEDGIPYIPEGVVLGRRIPKELIPYCPICRRPMAMNLRADNTFVEDAGWYRAAKDCRDFLNRYGEGKILFLELGVGYNTPSIIKYPFWQMTAKNPNAVYVCLNQGEAACPKEIAGRSIGIDGDIGDVLEELKIWKDK